MRKIAAFLFCSLFFCSCTYNDSPPIKKSEYLLGTLVSISIYDNTSDSEQLINECFELVREFENKVSFNNCDSELSYINSKAYENPVCASDELFDIIDKALYFCEKSQGAFDIGIGRLIEIWGIGTENARVPSYNEISPYIGFKAYENIILDSKNKTVSFSDKRVKIHLGACAKGYAEDNVIAYLKENGVKSALLNFGGSISVIGKKNNNDFSIGIANPNDDSTNLKTIFVSDTSVVTSGDYQRYFIDNDIKYHHIIDTSDGYPSDNGIQSVTIVCNSAFKADCLSTAAFVLGEKRGKELVLSEECEYIFYTNECLISDGIKFED